MKHIRKFWASPIQYLAANNPDRPIAFFSPAALSQTAQEFLNGFPGLVTYAVKSNPKTEIIHALYNAGITAFDVASPVEIDLIKSIAPTADMHYNNPIRSRAEITHAIAQGITSYSVDRLSELQKLRDGGLAQGSEVSIRLKLPISGAFYDFGEKFGASADQAQVLLLAAQHMGFTPSMAFHPGTQCADPAAWAQYIRVCADISRKAQVPLTRLNVGGGFASQRGAERPNLSAIFITIESETRAAFGDNPPLLLCEPGRAMVAEAVTLATRIKARPAKDVIFLNDGLYGGLAELRDMCPNTRVTVLSPTGVERTGDPSSFTVFGPTCDSLDRLNEALALPDMLQEDDYLLFAGMGAYATSIATRFNGYGDIETVILNAA